VVISLNHQWESITSTSSLKRHGSTGETTIGATGTQISSIQRTVELWPTQPQGSGELFARNAVHCPP
jgi:hypothetical protein